MFFTNNLRNSLGYFLSKTERNHIVKESVTVEWFEKFSLINFSISLFAMSVNLLHPQPSWFLYSLLLSLSCFSIFVKYYLQVSFNLTVILSMLKITQNTETEPL